MNFLIGLTVCALCLPPIVGAATPVNLLDIVTNGNFSQSGSNGQPVGWSCNCLDGSTCAANPQFTIRPGCFLWTNIASPKGRIRLKVVTDSAPGHPLDLSLRTNSHLITGSLETAQVGQATDIADGFESISSFISTRNSDRALVYLGNSAKDPYTVLRVAVEEDASDAGPLKTASILRGTTYMAGTYDATVSNGTAWIPLPMDYASQVPLSTDLKVTPQEWVSSVQYLTDDVGNWGVRVQMKPETPKGKFVSYKAVTYVLSLVTSDADKPTMFAAPASVEEWLKPSVDVEADDPMIVSAANQSISPSGDSLSKLASVLDWTTKNIAGGQSPVYAFDASTVIRNPETSCTGFANIGAALGRAAGLPAQSLANFLVGMPEQTHWINQFYLGPALGWRRVEPQAATIAVTDDYVIPIRIDRLSDENNWVYTLGIAGNSYPISSIAVADQSAEFPDCPFCLTRGEHVQDLHISQATMRILFQTARKLWRDDGIQLMLGKGPYAPIRSLRARITSVESDKEFRAWLNMLTLR